MKNLIAFILLLFSNTIQAQNPQTVVTIPYSPSNLNGWLYLPAKYNLETARYPVVVFCHGVGEAGSNINIVLNNGIPQLISNGMRPDNITDPGTGGKFSFITIATQSADWSPRPPEVLATINWLKKNYRVDSTRIYITGLSAGGEETVDAITYTQEMANIFSAAAPLSMAQSINPDIPHLQYAYNAKIYTWFLCGDADPFLPQTQWISSRFNQVFPGSAITTIYSGGHCCWNTYYNISYINPVSGYSMWQWFLKFKKQSSLPVTFGYFTSACSDAGINIQWSTESESNNGYFIIEKSTDGASFSEVARVQSLAINGNSSSTLKYQFVYEN